MPAERTGSDKDIVIGINTTDQDSVEVANLNVDALHSNSNSLETGSSVDFRDLDQLTQQDLRAFEKLQAELERLQGTNTQSQISENSNDGGCNSQIYYDSSSAESIQSKIGSDTSTITTASTDSLVCSQTNSQDSSVELVKTSTVKRSLVNSTAVPPVVTKVIITSKNSSNNQPQAIPVHLNQVQGQVVTLSPGVNILPHTSQTPSKITISAHGIASPNKSVTSIMGTPTKSGMPVNKLPISPAKTPTKITMIPVSITKSPQRTVPASSVVTMVTRTVNVAERAALSTNSSAVSTSAKPATITMSPSKFIIKQGNTSKTNESQQLQLSVSKSLQVGAQQSVRQVTGINNPSVQQISVPGSKFHYVRLVTPTTQASTTTVAKAATTVTSVVQARPIVPAAVVSSGSHNASSQKKITLPVQGNQPKSTSSQGSTATVQRFLLPAPSQIAIRSSTSTTGTTNLTQIRPNLSTTTTSNLLPPTAIIPSGNSIPGMQGYALVSATYVTQLQQQQQNNKQGAMTSQQRSEFIPIASNDPVVTANTLARNSINGSAIEATGARPRKPCNCTKSRCLKLYCDCFANGEFCHNCNCTNCANNLGFEELRSKSIKACLERNPTAFHPKIGKGKDGDNDRRHNKGCNCKRSGCLKNYCECYEAKIMCSSICKCVGCKNYEESPERKTLMHLADAAEVRVQQQTAAKTKLSSQISGLPSRPPVSTATGEKLPYTFVTTDVAAASCACLVAQAEESDRLRMPQVIQERMVIEEFGRCLMQVIDAANKTKGDLFTSNSSR